MLLSFILCVLAKEKKNLVQLYSTKQSQISLLICVNYLRSTEAISSKYIRSGAFFAFLELLNMEASALLGFFSIINLLI